MGYEKDIIEKVVNNIHPLFEDKEDVSVIPYYEFLDERTTFMIVVGIDTVTQVNIGLEDYEYELNITVDALIADDRSGEEFNNICKTLEAKLLDYAVKRIPLIDLFEDVPVCGFIYTMVDYSITNEANRGVFRYKVYTSNPMKI